MHVDRIMNDFLYTRRNYNSSYKFSRDLQFSRWRHFHSVAIAYAYRINTGCEADSLTCKYGA